MVPVLAQLMVQVAVGDVIRLLGAMAGRNSWPPEGAGHGKSQT